MEKLNNKSLGIPLCLIFGMPILGCIYSFLCAKLGLYDPTFSSIFWIVSNLITACSFFFIGRNVHFAKHVGNISAYVMGGIYILYLISHLCYLFANFYLMAEVGAAIRIAISILCLVAIILILIFSNAWQPVKIVGIVSYIPSIISIIISSQFQSAFEKQQETHDFEPYARLVNAFETVGYIESAIFLVALILTIIWLSKKEITPSARQQTIDLI